MRTVRLSKSKIVSGLQCSRRLWLELHQPRLAVVEASQRRSFAAGHQVGSVARGLYPGGVLVESQQNLSEAVRRTQRLLAGSSDVVLYEPAFRYRDVLVRADVFVRAGGRGKLVEVKSAASVKPHHVTDAGIQAWVVAGQGEPVEAVVVAHIDTSFVYPGGERYEGLFREVDVTAQARALSQRLPALVHGLRLMAAGPAPSVGVGEHCHEPFRCPFIGACEKRAAAGSAVAPAPAAAASAVPGAAASAVPASVRRRLAALPFPRTYLTIASVNPAVPLWPGTRPYQHTPFAWSCHKQHDPASELEHGGFLAEGDRAIARAFATTLIAFLGAGAGPVIVSDRAAGDRLRELAASLPDRGPELASVVGRVVDLERLAPPTSRLAPPRPLDALEELGGISAAEAYLELVGHPLPAADGSAGAGGAEGGFGQASFADLPEAVTARRAALRNALALAVERESRALAELARATAGAQTV